MAKLVLKKKTLQAPPVGHAQPRPREGLDDLEAWDNPLRPWGTVGSFMSIDPGFTGTGYAIWKRETFDKLEPPIASGSIVVRTDKLWWIDASHAADTLISLCQRYCVYNVYAELPKFMETAGAGLSAARDGDLVKLTTLFGIIAGRLCDNRVRIFTPVPVQEWKGNMPKDICNQRILGRFNGTWKPVTKTTHEVDAVGIGLYVKGLF